MDLKVLLFHLPVSVGVAAINMAVDNGNAKELGACLLNTDVALHSVTPECTNTYLTKLTKYKDKKRKAGSLIIA